MNGSLLREDQNLIKKQYIKLFLDQFLNVNFSVINIDSWFEKQVILKSG